MTPKSLVPQRAVQVGGVGQDLSFLSDYVTDTLSSAPQLDALVFSGGIGERSSRLSS
jgi:acetate kinase